MIQIFTCDDCLEKFGQENIATVEWLRYTRMQSYIAFCKKCLRKENE